jgi:hypothetical protein
MANCLTRVLGEWSTAPVYIADREVDPPSLYDVSYCVFCFTHPNVYNVSRMAIQACGMRGSGGSPLLQPPFSAAPKR